MLEAFDSSFSSSSYGEEKLMGSEAGCGGMKPASSIVI